MVCSAQCYVWCYLLCVLVQVVHRYVQYLVHLETSGHTTSDLVDHWIYGSDGPQDLVSGDVLGVLPATLDITLYAPVPAA